MYINRALLLMLGFVLVLFPIVEQWIISDHIKWYRPWQAWLLIVAAAYWNQRNRYPDDL